MPKSDPLTTTIKVLRFGMITIDLTVAQFSQHLRIALEQRLTTMEFHTFFVNLIGTIDCVHKNLLCPMTIGLVRIGLKSSLQLTSSAIYPMHKDSFSPKRQLLGVLPTITFY